jgi:hypothetical protein
MYALIQPELFSTDEENAKPHKPIMTGNYRTLSALRNNVARYYWNTTTVRKMTVKYFSDIAQDDPFKIEHWDYDHGTVIT